MKLSTKGLQAAGRFLLIIFSMIAFVAFLILGVDYMVEYRINPAYVFAPLIVIIIIGAAIGVYHDHKLIDQQPTKLWVTEIWAEKPNDTSWIDKCTPCPTYKWQGPHVPGATMQEAQEYCNKNGLGYCRVVGVLVEEGYIETVLDNAN